MVGWHHRLNEQESEQTLGAGEGQGCVATFSLSSFIFIKRLFSSLFSAIRVVSPAYLRLLLFLPAILIPVCASSSPAFHMMYSAYKFNKQGDNYSLDVLLSRFGNSLLFHVQF